MLENSRGSASTLASVQPSDALGPTASDSRPGESVWPEILGIDASEAARVLGDDPGFLRELLQTFLSDNANALEEIERHLAAGDQPSAAKRAHKLRGQAANIGATRLSHAAGILEEGLDQGMSDLEARLSLFETAYGQLFSAARDWLQQPSSEAPTQQRYEVNRNDENDSRGG